MKADLSGLDALFWLAKVCICACLFVGVCIAAGLVYGIVHMI